MSTKSDKRTRKPKAEVSEVIAPIAPIEPIEPIEPPVVLVNTVEHVETKEVKQVKEAKETKDKKGKTKADKGEKGDKEKKSRAKKTPNVVAFVGPSGITGTFLSEQRPLIAHIPVTSAALEFENTNLLKYDPLVPEVPKAYDAGAEYMSYLDGMSEGEGVENEILSNTPTPQKEATVDTKETTHIANISQMEHVSVCKLPSNYSEKLMVLFQDANRYQKLPDKTETACFWCCHGFHSQPVAIPSHILDEIWYMYGCFCSPECATSYLFKERIDNNVQWERYALLNSLYSEDAELPCGASSGIRPAPPRETLRMFGGSMDIAEYRALVHERKLRVDVLTPPMVSIIQTMDTKPIDFYDQNLKNVFIKNDISHKYNAPGAQGLRLRRSKPVKSKESTVEWAMQIQRLAS
jgi:hypothetical protein